MAFTIPNVPDAAFTAQAELDSRDLEILTSAMNASAVVSGCAVTTTGSANGSANIASGIIKIVNEFVEVASGTVQFTANSSGNPRFDLVTVDTAGAKAAVVGTPGAVPVFPVIPASRVVLAAVYIANGHTTSTTLAANTITDKRVILSAERLNFHNVLDYGAVGTNDTTNVNAVDCTQPIRDAAAAANLSIAETLKSDLNGTGIVYFPGNRDYKITDTIDWPENVRMLGGMGNGVGAPIAARIRWHGVAATTDPANSIMFRQSTDNNNFAGIGIENLIFDGRGGNAGGGQAGYGNGANIAWWFGPVTTGNAKPDTGCWFKDVSIANLYGNGVHFAGKGITNWVWERGRFDQIGGYAIYVNVDGTCFMSIKDMTYDNWLSAEHDKSKGFLFLDGEAAPTTSVSKSFVGLTNLHLEVNGGYMQTYIPTGWSPTGCDTRGLIRLGVNTTVSSVVQHVISYSNVWVPVPNTTNPFSMFQFTSSDLAADNRARHAAAARITGFGLHGTSNGATSSEDSAGAVKFIGGINAADNYPFNPGSNTSRTPGVVSFHPANATSVPSGEQVVDFYNGRMLVRRLNLPTNATATGGAGTLPSQPAGFFVVYDDTNTERRIPYYNT